MAADIKLSDCLIAPPQSALLGLRKSLRRVFLVRY
jgi:hypothetical protein